MQKNKVRYIEHPEYSGELEFVKEGEELLLFLHLSVKNYTKEVLRQLREDLDVVLDLACENDIECVSFTLPAEQSTKFHNRVRPLDFEVQEEHYTIGGWYTR